jgi:hypothetical protein
LIVQSTPRRIKTLIGIPVFFEIAFSALIWFVSSHIATFFFGMRHSLPCIDVYGQKECDAGKEEGPWCSVSTTDQLGDSLSGTLPFGRQEPPASDTHLSEIAIRLTPTDFVLESAC